MGAPASHTRPHLELEPHSYPDHEQQLARLRKVEGQINGIRKMIEQHRDCTEILDQIKAVVGALRQIQMGVIECYLHHCIRNAGKSRGLELLQSQLEELVQCMKQQA